MKTQQLPARATIETIGGVAICLVDMAYVRARIDPNATNFAYYPHDSYVPRDEGWIDQDTKAEEIPFYVDNLLVQRSQMLKGVPYEKALAAGDRVEKAERIRANPTLQSDKDSSSCRLMQWGRTDSGVTVYVVDTDCMAVIDPNFTEGGHDKVYRYIPKGPYGTVYIDKAVYDDPQERGFDLLHELLERAKMDRAGWSYPRAHRLALKAEHYYRNHPAQLRPALAALGWHNF